MTSWVWSSGSLRSLSELEAEQHLLGVGQVADHAAQRRRQLLDQRRRREDLVLLGQLGCSRTSMISSS